ncbi:MAG: hypothetical protein ABFD20_09105 [Anaerolineales bacterium]
MTSSEAPRCDGLFELLAGAGLAGAGYLLLPATPPHADLARWAFLPVVLAALLLPAAEALLRRLGGDAGPGAPVAAGWRWLLLALLVLGLGAGAAVLVWMEVDSPLLAVLLQAVNAVLRHATAALGLTVGLICILIGYANAQWRLAITGTLWAVCGLGIDALLWGKLLPGWLQVLLTSRRVTALYLLTLGTLMALGGLVALLHLIVRRPLAPVDATTD